MDVDACLKREKSIHSTFLTYTRKAALDVAGNGHLPQRNCFYFLAIPMRSTSNLTSTFVPRSDRRALRIASEAR